MSNYVEEVLSLALMGRKKEERGLIKNFGVERHFATGKGHRSRLKEVALIQLEKEKDDARVKEEQRSPAGAAVCLLVKTFPILFRILAHART